MTRAKGACMRGRRRRTNGEWPGFSYLVGTSPRYRRNTDLTAKLTTGPAIVLWAAVG